MLKLDLTQIVGIVHRTFLRRRHLHKRVFGRRRSIRIARRQQHVDIDRIAQCAGGNVLVFIESPLVDRHGPAHATGIFAIPGDAAKLIRIAWANYLCLPQMLFLSVSTRTPCKLSAAIHGPNYSHRILIIDARTGGLWHGKLRRMAQVNVRLGRRTCAGNRARAGAAEARSLRCESRLSLSLFANRCFNEAAPKHAVSCCQPHAAGGCQSSTRLPSGSQIQANLPYSWSSRWGQCARRLRPTG